MTNLLAIDTAGPILGVALLQNGELCHCSDETGPLRHVEQVVPQIDATLALAGWHTRDLSAVAISAGPGSFTGLRVGMAAAKAVAMAGGIPLFSVDTLMALAATEQYRRGVDGSEGVDGSGQETPNLSVIVPVLDARKNRFYAAAFRNAPELPRLTEDGDLTTEELRDMIRGVLPTEVSRWCAPGPLTGLFQEVPGRVAAVAQGVSAAPGTALLGYRRFRQGTGDSEYQGPFYLRSGDIGKRSSIPRFIPSQRSDSLGDSD